MHRFKTIDGIPLRNTCLYNLWVSYALIPPLSHPNVGYDGHGKTLLLTVSINIGTI